MISRPAAVTQLWPTASGSRQALGPINRRNWKLIGEITSLSRLNWNSLQTLSPPFERLKPNAQFSTARGQRSRIQFVAPPRRAGVTIILLGAIVAYKAISGNAREKSRATARGGERPVSANLCVSAAIPRIFYSLYLLCRAQRALKCVLNESIF